MTDIATLGIRVDSSQLDNGTRALDRLGDQAVVTGTQVARSSAGMTRGFAATGGALQRMRPQIQNASFQFQDIITQMQMGTRASVVFGQQLPQLIGGFGAFGAAAGVAIAGATIAFGPLIDRLFDAQDATSGFVDELLQAPSGLDGIRGSISQLVDLQEAYTQAIEASGGASAGLASVVAANSRREFDARKQVLDVELELLRVRQLEQRSQLQNLQGAVQMRAEAARDATTAGIRGSRFNPRDGSEFFNAGPRTAGEVLGESFFEDTERDRLVMQRLRAEIDLTTLAIEEGELAFETGFQDIQGAIETATQAMGGGRAAARDLTASIVEASEAAQFWQQQQDTLKNGILDSIVAGDDLADTFRGIAQAIARASLEAALFGSGPLSGGGGAGLIGALFNADGNAFDHSGVIPFARGGVVDGATPFTFGGGKLGVMGEAGPEAILPLSRGPNGKLGVQAAPQRVEIMLTVEPSGEFDARVAGTSQQVAVSIVQANNRRIPAIMADAQRRGS